jgi:hypothetical protein
VDERPTTLKIRSVGRLRSGTRPWLWINLLSLDAPLVAVVWQALFAKCMTTPIHPAAFAVLGLSVWFIYVSDRLLDALGQYGNRAARHRFYREYWNIFSTMAVTALFAIGMLCARLDPRVIRNGLVLLTAVLVYLVLVHFGPDTGRRFWPKELAVAVLFAIGTGLVTWSRTEFPQSSMVLPICLFAALCWLNCTAVEYWEWKAARDTCDLPPHPVTVWLGLHLDSISFGIFVCCAVVFCWLPVRLQPIVASSLISAAALFWLDRNRDRFSADAQRVLVDVTLLSPMIFVLAKPGT